MEHLEKPARRPGGRHIEDTQDAVEEEKQRRQQRYQRDHDACTIEHPRTTQRLEAWGNAIDLGEVAGIFHMYVQKAGVDRVRMNLPDRIYFCEDLGDAAMNYDPISNSMRINTQYYERELARIPEDTVQSGFLHGIFHELTHATGVINIRWTAATDDGCNMRAQRIGYLASMRKIKPDLDDPSAAHVDKLQAFLLFNEGVTEQISHEVFLEYLRRDPQPEHGAEFKDAAVRYLIGTITEGHDLYDAARHIVVAMTAAIAEDTGVPEDIVWRGFVRQYYSGEILPNEIGTLLNETFGPGFSKRLATARTVQDLQEIALACRKLSVHYPGVREKWIEHLKLSRGAN